MDKLLVRGQRPLLGTVRVSGAKNAALPALAACLLTEHTIELTELPDVWDVGTMRRLLTRLGVAVDQHTDSHWSLECRQIEAFDAPYDLVKTMRASILVLGPLLARRGRARVSLPGGCAIGQRPIDLHLKGLAAMGASIRLEHGFVEAQCERLRGVPFHFDTVSVTGTENLMLAATLAEGETVLSGCAREPEITDLAALLVGMGADIEGAGDETIRIRGVQTLMGASHRVMPDRIEAGTFALAAALLAGKGGIKLEGFPSKHLRALKDILESVGAPWEDKEDFTRIGRANGAGEIQVATAPYPGFATDLQAQLMVLATQVPGESLIEETIFENRFMHVAELSRMGADIRLSGRYAHIRGSTPLSGAKVMATDLRASASLVLAGLLASGETLIDRVYHLDRGYEHIEQKLRGLGAQIERVTG